MTKYSNFFRINFFSGFCPISRSTGQPGGCRCPTAGPPAPALLTGASCRAAARGTCPGRNLLRSAAPCRCRRRRCGGAARSRRARSGAHGRCPAPLRRPGARLRGRRCSPTSTRSRRFATTCRLAARRSRCRGSGSWVGDAPRAPGLGHHHAARSPRGRKRGVALVRPGDRRRCFSSSFYFYRCE